MGYSEHAQRPQAPQKPLGRFWGCRHSLTQEGRCRKNQMPLSTTPEGAPGGLCWEDLELRDAAQGRQRLLGHSHSLFHAQGIPGNTRSGAVAMGLWFSSRNPAVSQGMSSSLCPTLLAIPRFGSFPLVSAELQGPAGEDHSSSFLPRAVFLPCLWQFCPGAGGGDPSECLVSAVCSSQSSVCSVPAASSI